MKKLMFLAIGAVFLFSCDRDIELNESVLDTDSKKLVIVDGIPYFAGYGYEPATDREFKPAIQEGNIFETTNLGGDVFDVSLQVVNNEKEVEDLVSKGRSRGFKIGFSIFSFGSDRTKNITRHTKFESKYVNIVARVKIKTSKYRADGSPELNDQAKQLIDEGKFDQFVSNYGYSYVSSNTLGGEIYYVYTFDFTKQEEMNRSEFTRGVNLGIGSYFGLNSGGSGGSTSSELINRTLESVNIVSTVPGFSPRPIKNEEDLSSESDRLISYLDNNPTKAPTVDMEVSFYSNFIDKEGLRQKENDRKTCYDKLTQWNEIENRLAEIKSKTTIGKLRRLAEKDLREANDAISRARDCNGSYGPKNFETTYDWFEAESLTDPIYRYYNSVQRDHYLTVSDHLNKTSGEGDWKFQRIEGRMFPSYRPTIANTKPVYLYYDSNLNDHMFTDHYRGESFDQTNYMNKGIVGYVYKDQNGSATSEGERTAMHQYYNDEIKDHFYTTNWNELKDGANGYRYYGVFGHVMNED